MDELDDLLELSDKEANENANKTCLVCNNGISDNVDYFEKDGMHIHKSCAECSNCKDKLQNVKTILILQGNFGWGC